MSYNVLVYVRNHPLAKPGDVIGVVIRATDEGGDIGEGIANAVTKSTDHIGLPQLEGEKGRGVTVQVEAFPADWPLEAVEG